MQFEAADLAAMAAAKEVDIETRSKAGEIHRTVIWIAERDGQVYIRSYLGARGRWYREALADPNVAIHIGGRRIPAKAVPATDPASIEACSEGLTAKYRRSQSLRAMLVPDVLPTTLKLVPA
ncbi:MAG TPA: nitroreductase/quinone reductase family protein [Candidatus Binatia bacterium]|nr:nitroreductase/quinone reductase family protein [Candidatus Binatia bacterium]